ncbi:MAG: M1 family metallopeptidase [Saprospiraceae bacterium]
MRISTGISCILLFILVNLSCKQHSNHKLLIPEDDPHSFSNPEQSKVLHLDLDLNLNFDSNQIQGIVKLHLAPGHGDTLVLDNMDLEILEVQLIQGTSDLKANFYQLPKDPVLGSALVIPLNATTESVQITYKSSPGARALQWLPKEQTLSKKYPFLFTQSQSIYSRSWIPCPDGPGMRFTYHAKVHVPPGMMAVMSATNGIVRNQEGIYEFDMELPVPAYLMALAVGDFDFKPIGQRTGVYAEPSLINKAAAEFSDLEKMLEAAEKLYGPYPWGRYDVIVLPGSFPFGGMENPRMTFLTPSVIAGDQSLTSLLAHELAHSWSGNLVTNSTWNDFWLNEGITTYFESRIMESLYGKPYADMLSLLGLQDLEKSIAEFGTDNPLTKLKLNLKGLDPEDGVSDIAYEKGKSFMRYLEERFGRETFDRFLIAYFDHFKFQSNTSEGFLEFAKTNLFKNNSGVLDTANQWIYNPGWLAYKASYDDKKFLDLEVQATNYFANQDTAMLKTSAWSTHEWLYFIRLLPKDSGTVMCNQLDKAYHLSDGRNCEIQCAWFEYAIKNGYGKQLLPEIEKFLINYGRRKYLKPIYTALMDHQMEPDALRIFYKANSHYHPISLVSIEKIVQPKN